MRARYPTAEARRGKEGSPRGLRAPQVCKPGSVFGGEGAKAPGTLRAAKGGERRERGPPEGGQAGPATSSQKAPATHSPQPVRPRSDQGRVRPGSGCQGSGRPYPTGSWGGPGRDIVPGKVCFLTATPSRELCRTGMRKAAPGLGRGERRGPELGAGPGLGRRRDREPQTDDRGGAGRDVGRG